MLHGSWGSMFWTAQRPVVYYPLAPHVSQTPAMSALAMLAIVLVAGVLCTAAPASAYFPELFTPALNSPIDPIKQKLLVLHEKYSLQKMAANLGFENYTSAAGFRFAFAAAVDWAHARQTHFLARLEFEEPNFLFRLWGLSEAEQQVYVRNEIEAVDLTFTLCPFTAKWYNGFTQTPSHHPMIYPINPSMLPEIAPPQDKVHDIIYVGTRCKLPLAIEEAFEAMKNFKYMWIGPPREQGKCTRREPTHILDFRRTLREVARAKVVLVHNELKPPKGTPPELLRSNEAFAGVFQAWDGCAKRQGEAMHERAGGCLRGVSVPQLKQRTLTAAAVGTVSLVHNDSGARLIEHFFTPDVHFVYFNSTADFVAKLRHILANYEDYVPMLERARERVLRQYTVQHFVDEYFVPLVNRIDAQPNAQLPPEPKRVNRHKHRFGLGLGKAPSRPQPMPP